MNMTPSSVKSFFARIRQDCLYENKRIATDINRNQESEMSET